MADDWDLNEIQKVVEKSGRPLEVRCGMAFLKSEWNVSQGTYYKDVLDGVSREMDIIAGKIQKVEVGKASITCRMGVFVSCKGFSPDQLPVSFSLDTEKFPDYLPPSFMSAGIPNLDVHAFHQANLARDMMFSNGELDHGRRLYAFDVIEKKYPNRNPNQPPKDRGANAPPVKEVVNYTRMGDNALYKGMDSAVKSAMHWQKITNRKGLHIRIPVLLTSRDWLDYPIDDGVLGKPVPMSAGFKSNLYPSAVTPKSEMDWVTTIVWSESKLPALIKLLNKVFENFLNEVKGDLRNGKYSG